jgi:hypothetical protein
MRMKQQLGLNFAYQFYPILSVKKNTNSLIKRAQNKNVSKLNY